MPGPPTPTAVSGRRPAVRRPRAWTPSLLPPRGSRRGKGRAGEGGPPEAPSPGPPAPPPGPGRREPARDPGAARRGTEARGGPGPGRRGAAGGRAAAPSAVRGPGVGGPEGCWRLRLALSPSPGLCLSLWSHPEVPQRRCLTRCPPAARPRAGRGGAGASGALPPSPSALPGAAAAFCTGASARLLRPGPHPSGLPLSAAPPLPAPRSGLLRLLPLPAAPGPCQSVSLSLPLFHPSPSLSLHLPASLFSSRSSSLSSCLSLCVSVSRCVSPFLSLISAPSPYIYASLQTPQAPHSPLPASPFPCSLFLPVCLSVSDCETDQRRTRGWKSPNPFFYFPFLLQTTPPHPATSHLWETGTLMCFPEAICVCVCLCARWLVHACYGCVVSVYEYGEFGVFKCVCLETSLYPSAHF